MDIFENDSERAYLHFDMLLSYDNINQIVDKYDYKPFLVGLEKFKREYGVFEGKPYMSNVNNIKKKINDILYKKYPNITLQFFADKEFKKILADKLSDDDDMYLFKKYILAKKFDYKSICTPRVLSHVDDECTDANCAKSAKKKVVKIAQKFITGVKNCKIITKYDKNYTKIKITPNSSGNMEIEYYRNYLVPIAQEHHEHNIFKNKEYMDYIYKEQKYYLMTTGIYKLSNNDGKSILTNKLDYYNLYYHFIIEFYSILSKLGHSYSINNKDKEANFLIPKLLLIWLYSKNKGEQLHSNLPAIDLVEKQLDYDRHYYHYILKEHRESGQAPEEIEWPEIRLGLSQKHMRQYSQNDISRFQRNAVDDYDDDRTKNVFNLWGYWGDINGSTVSPSSAASVHPVAGVGRLSNPSASVHSTVSAAAVRTQAGDPPLPPMTGRITAFPLDNWIDIQDLNYRLSKLTNILKNRQIIDIIKTKLKNQKKNINDIFYYFKINKDMHSTNLETWQKLTDMAINIDTDYFHKPFLLFHDALMNLYNNNYSYAEGVETYFDKFLHIIQNKETLFDHQNNHISNTNDLDIKYWEKNNFFKDNIPVDITQDVVKNFFIQNIKTLFYNETPNQKSKLDYILGGIVRNNVIMSQCNRIIVYRHKIIIYIKKLIDVLDKYYYTKINKYKILYINEIQDHFSTILYIFDILKKFYCNLDDNLKVIFGPFYNIDTIKEIIELFIDYQYYDKYNYFNEKYKNSDFHKLLKDTIIILLNKIDNNDGLLSSNIDLFEKLWTNTNIQKDNIYDYVYKYSSLYLNKNINKDTDLNIDKGEINFKYLDLDIKNYIDTLKLVRNYETSKNTKDMNYITLISNLINGLNIHEKEYNENIDSDTLEFKSLITDDELLVIMNGLDIESNFADQVNNEEIINIAKVLKFEINKDIEMRYMLYIIYMYMITIENMFYNKYILTIYNNICNNNDIFFQKELQNRTKNKRTDKLKNFIQLPITHLSSYDLMLDIFTKQFRYIIKDLSWLDETHLKHIPRNFVITEDDNKKKINKHHKKSSFNTTKHIHDYYKKYISEIRTKFTDEMKQKLDDIVDKEGSVSNYSPSLTVADPSTVLQQPVASARRRLSIARRSSTTNPWSIARVGLDFFGSVVSKVMGDPIVPYGRPKALHFKHKSSQRPVPGSTLGGCSESVDRKRKSKRKKHKFLILNKKN